ncbi:MAG: fused MFS/spermidine synthase [Deltaproteobacteria bacterium]|nr:fused MFS/spermidine synthase [Deltaproteobacteria bacterium]
MFELVWIRAMGVHFGTTAPAISTVLAAFMAGLALGSILLGPRADRSTRPLHLYRVLELGIAVSGLAVSLLLLRGDAVLASLAQGLAAAGPAAPIVRAGLFASLMLLPTTLMGGTLPVLSRALARSGTTGRVIGSLYAINTGGAVVGVLLPDFALVPSVGLTATAGLAALGNLFVALMVSRVAPDVPPSPAPTEPAAQPALPWAPVLLFAVSGLCAMGYEVVWSRMLAHWVPGTVASFSVLLAVYLVCLSIGSAFGTRRADASDHPLATAATLLVATGLSVVLSIAGAGFVPELLQAAVPGVHDGWRAGAGETFLLSLLTSVYLEAIPCLLMGAAFPYLAAAAVRAGAVGRATGRLYAVNTMFGVVGSIATGFLLLGALGVQGALLSLATLAVLAGAGALLVSTARTPRRWIPSFALALGALVVGLSVPADHLNRSLLGDRRDYVVAMEEGATTTAAVIEHTRFGELVEMELFTPGVSMSGTKFGVQRYMSLMAQVPLLLSKERSDALLICYGVGNTARSLLSHPGLERLDVADLSPEVVSLSGHFSKVHGGDPLEDPRAHVHVEDGRQFLLRTEQRYDVITSEPPPPTDAGVVNLYTREYYAVARERLKPEGVLAQWLPLFQLSVDETRGIIASFVAEFPHVALYRGYRYQWFLVGSKSPLSIDLASWQEHVRQPTVAGELHRVGIDGVEDLLATYAAGQTQLETVADGVRAITDDLPLLQYPSERLFGWVKYPGVLDAPPTTVLDHVDGGRWGLDAAGLGPSFDRATLIDSFVRQAAPYMVLAEPEARELAMGRLLSRALALRPEDPQVWALLELDGDTVRAARVAVEAGRNLPAAHWILARVALYDGSFDIALNNLERVAPEDVGPAHYWLVRGAVERALGRGEAAASSFARVGATTSQARVRAEAEGLVAAAAAPFAPSAGPMSLDPATP